jgi:hypothetical protein
MNDIRTTLASIELHLKHLPEMKQRLDDLLQEMRLERLKKPLWQRSYDTGSAILQEDATRT